MPPDCRFPRSARLLSASDYACVFRDSKRVSDRYWTILVRSGVIGPARLGLAIAKKRARRAVDRNRIKRVARESFRCHRYHLPGLELVVMNRDDAVKLDDARLRAALDKLLERISAAHMKV